MLETLNSSNFHFVSFLRKSVATSKRYWGNQKVYLLKVRAILICALGIFALAPSVIWSNEKPDNTSQNLVKINNVKMFSSRTANGKVFSEQTLLNDNLILKFLTHPKTHSLILEGRNKLRLLGSSIYPELEQFEKAYPSIPEVQDFVQSCKVAYQLFPYESVVVPFLALGVILDYSGVNDPATLKAIQTFQVRIFKYWLSLYKIGEQDKHLFKNLLDFSRTSSLSLFSKLIFPIFNAKIEGDEQPNDTDHYDEIIAFFINAEWAEYEEEKVKGNELDSAIAQKINESVNQQLAQQFTEQENRKSPGEKIVENFRENLAKKYPDVESKANEIEQKYFSRDAIIQLFLEIVES